MAEEASCDSRGPSGTNVSQSVPHEELVILVFSQGITSYHIMIAVFVFHTMSVERLLTKASTSP